MTTSRPNCICRMQLATMYLVLIVTYFVTSCSTSSATGGTATHHLPIRQKGQHKGRTDQSASQAELKQTREYAFDPIIYKHEDEDSPSSLNKNKNVGGDLDIAQLVLKPNLLDFGDMPIGDSYTEVVTIFNRHPNRSVSLISISGLAADFYSTFFGDEVIQPLGNTTFTVTFTPRQQGDIISSLQIHSTFGVSQYMLKGGGIDYRFRLNSFLKLRAPLNATLVPEIVIYNPYPVPLHIVEVFSSGVQFKLELPNNDPQIPRGMWKIPAYNTQSVIHLRFKATTPGHHKTMVRMVISGNIPELNDDELRVPMEYEITNESGVYTEQAFVNFGKGGRLDPPKKVVFRLLNSGHDEINIKSYVVEGAGDLDQAITLRVSSRDYSKGTAGDEDLTRIHMFTATIDWTKLKVRQFIRGHITIRTVLSNKELPLYRIPIVGEVIEGSIYYSENQTQFPTTFKLVKSTKGFTIRNDFEVPLAITNVSLPPDTVKYFKASPFEPTMLQPGEESLLFRITQLAAATKRPITRTLYLHTNASTYEVPLSSYSGLLRRIVPVDETTHGGAGTDEEIINYGTLPLSTVTDTVVAFVNDSPKPITIHNWTATISEAASIFVILRGCGQLTMNNLKFCYSIQPHEWMLFQVSVLSNAIGTFAGQLALQTDYEELVTPVRFSTAVGRLQFSATMLDEHLCFPGGLCTVNLTAYSSFALSMDVHGILVNVTGTTYDFSARQFPAIAANKLTRIGQLQFSPNKICGEECYVDFPDRWPPSVISNNCRNLQPDLLHQKLEAFRVMRTSFSAITFRVHTSHVRRYEFNSSGSIMWPKLVTHGGPIEFPTYQVGQEVLKEIEVANPTDQPIRLYYMLHDVARHGSAMTYPPEVMTLCWDCFLSRDNVFSLVDMDDPKHTSLQYIPPRSTSKVTVRFFASNAGSYANLLYIRNNFTILEALWLTAKAAAHQFKFGNRIPGSGEALSFNLTEKQYRDCKHRAEHPDSPPVIVNAKRTFTAKNLGDVPIDVYGMYIEGMRCKGYGFRILNCMQFRLPPDSSKKVEIIFTPDFTLARIDHILSIETSLHYDINYTLSSMVPSSVLHICGKVLLRPTWEYQMRFIAFGVLTVSFLLVMVAAFCDAEKITRDHHINVSKDKGPIEPTLDLRQIGLRFEDAKNLSAATVVASSTPSTGYNGNKIKQNSELRKRGTSKRNDVEPTLLQPKSWANVLVRKISPIKSDVKFRDISPPPPSLSNRSADKKKESSKQPVFKDVTAFMDATNSKQPKGNDDETSSTTTEGSMLSNGKKSPIINRKTKHVPIVPIVPPVATPVTTVTTTTTTTPTVVSVPEANHNHKPKGKTSIKKTKSLPPQPLVLKETTEAAASILSVSTAPKMSKSTSHVVSPPPPKSVSSNGKLDGKPESRLLNTTTTTSSMESKQNNNSSSVFTPSHIKDIKEQHNNNTNNPNRTHTIISPTAELDKATTTTPNQPRKYGKTPGRERRKEQNAIPVTRKQNLSKMNENHKPGKGSTAFAFSAPLVTAASSTAAPVQSVVNSSTTSNSVWDISKTSFSTIVAQAPVSETCLGISTSQNVFPFSVDTKTQAAAISTISSNSDANNAIMTSTSRFTKTTNGDSIFDYPSLADGHKLETSINDTPALKLHDLTGGELLSSHLKQGVDLGPIGTRKSPSDTPTWEIFPSINKPIAMLPTNGAANHNSYFSDSFPRYSNTLLDQSNATTRNDTMANDTRGVSGLFDDIYGTNSKDSFWSKSSWPMEPKEQHRQQQQQQPSLLSSQNTNGLVGYDTQQHQIQSLGFNLPIDSTLFDQTSSQQSNMFSDPNTLWGTNYVPVSDMPKVDWNAPAPVGPIRPPPGLERQSIPNRLLNQQQASDASGARGVSGFSSHHNFSSTNNNLMANHDLTPFGTFNSLSSIWTGNSYNPVTSSPSSVASPLSLNRHHNHHHPHHLANSPSAGPQTDNTNTSPK